MERVLAEQTQEERTEAVRRVLVWYLYAADAGRRALLPYSAAVPLVPVGEIEVIDNFEVALQAMRWFEAERLNLLATIRQASELGQYDIGWKLAMASSSFFELGSYWSDWEENHRIGLASALALGDLLGEAANTLMLGDAAWRIGRLDEAAEKYERAVQLGRDVSIGWLEGFALRGLGLVHEGLDDVAEASGHFESAMRVFRSSGFRRGEAMSLLSLGKCARALGDLPRAVSSCAEAVAILEEIRDAWTVAWGRLDLAASLQGLGRTSDAVAQLRQAAGIFGEFRDQGSEAQTLVSLGELLLAAGDLVGAHVSWSRAANIYEAINDLRSMEIRVRLGGLGHAA